mgnify:CR=1 FL=1
MGRVSIKNPVAGATGGTFTDGFVVIYTPATTTQTKIAIAMVETRFLFILEMLFPDFFLAIFCNKP